MKNYSLLVLFLLVALASLVNATSQPICGYTTIKGEFKGLPHIPDTKYEAEYIDYGNNGNKVCIQRASCPDPNTYATRIEKCSDLKVDCNTRGSSEFPACCVKC